MDSRQNHGVQRRWNRKQIRQALRWQKQVNVLLSIILIVRLDPLAKQHGVKRDQIIEPLMSSNSGASVPHQVDEGGSASRDNLTNLKIHISMPSSLSIGQVFQKVFHLVLQPIFSSHISYIYPIVSNAPGTPNSRNEDALGCLFLEFEF